MKLVATSTRERRDDDDDIIIIIVINSNNRHCVPKLRKHCAKKRLNDIRQLGMDRAVVLTFGAKETETKLVVELYAAGTRFCATANYGVDGAESARGGRRT